MYPRNAASPPRLAIGPVVQISDGAVQTAGVAVKVIPQGGTEASGAGTVAYSADGAVLYTPTQAETDYIAVVFVASKAGCIPATVTVVTSASATAGYAGLDWAKIIAPTTAVALTGTTISTSQVAASVTARVTANTDQWGGAAVTGMPMPTYTQPTGFLAATFPGTVSSYAGGAVASVTGAVGSVASPVTVGTNNDKTGYSLTVTPPTAAAIADAVWDEIMSTHTVNGSYGSHVVRSANQNQNTVTITGSQHVAADVHELQAAVITADKFAANWLTAAGTAADYITEIQTGLATSAAQTTAQSDIDDIQSRLPASLVAGRMDASVGAMQADTVTSAALAASAVTEIQTGLATSAAQTTAQSDIDDIQSRLPAALVAGRMDASVGAMQADTVTSAALAASAITEIQAGLSTLTDVQVKAQIIEALSVDILAEISTIPGASSTLTDRIGLLFALARNKLTQTSALQTVFADNGSTTIGTATVADNGTTFTRDKLS